MEQATRRKWSLTQDAFDSLLGALGPDRDSAAKRYLEIRANLVRLFEWRGAPAPDDHADEVINRCAKKIGEGEEVRDIGTYCVGIARMVALEMSRAPERKSVSLEQTAELTAASTQLDDQDREDCLRHCLSQLSEENKNFILRYYQGEKSAKIENRQELSQRFGIPPSTLRMRALRLREKLQLCAETCIEGKLM